MPTHRCLQQLFWNACSQLPQLRQCPSWANLYDSSESRPHLHITPDLRNSHWSAALSRGPRRACQRRADATRAAASTLVSEAKSDRPVSHLSVKESDKVAGPSEKCRRPFNSIVAMSASERIGRRW